MNTITRVAVLLAAVTLSCSNVLNPENKNGDFELLILHNNDMHARFEQTSQLSGTCTVADRDAGKCYGGFPRVAHVVKEARKAAAKGEGPPVLYLNAGDTYTGTAWFSIYKWRIAAEFMNALQPDAVSLGNHEFDNGVSGLTPFIENLTCPVLACNLNLTKEPALAAERNLMDSVIINIDGTKIGIIGYLTPETKFLAINNNVQYIEEVAAIKKEVTRIKNSSVNILIALGHSGFTKDLQIAKEVEDIDLVIGGHTNTFLWNGTSPDVEKSQGPYPTLVKQKSGRIIPVVQAYAYTKYLGKLHLSFDTKGELVNFNGNPILLDNSVIQDPEVLDIVNRYQTEVAKVSELVVGNTSVILDGQSCRIKECNMGNIITDSMIYKYASNYIGTGWTDAPIAILQGGGIRASIAHVKPLSNITRGDLLTVLPFDGPMAKIKINGSNILKALEHSVEKYNLISSPGQFLQMSGLKVEYDFKYPPGQRVINVLIRCGMCDLPEYINLNKTKEYNILMPSFLAMGGDNFKMFLDQPSTSMPYNELDSLTEYTLKRSPVYPAVEGRIIIHNVEKLKNNSASLPKLSINLITFAHLVILLSYLK